MVIFRTSKETIDKVVSHCKHALNGKPDLTPGEDILISQTVSTTRDGRPPIRYIMQFVRIYRDTDGESKRIWGKKWNYIIEGENCITLKKPFNISNHQVSDKNYGPGGPVTYVADVDVKTLKKKGLLETI